MRSFVPLLCILPLFACLPRVDTGADGGGPIVVGPEGGIFFREGTVLEIPANAVTSQTTIVVTVLDSSIPEVPGRKRVSLGYRLSPASLVFREPVKLSFAYLDDRVPPGVEPATFDMRRQSGDDAYLALPGAAALPEFKAVSARTDRLGLFWLTSPPQAAISKLTLEPPEALLRVGDSQQFTASVVDPTGKPIEMPITFSVTPPRVATVTAEGRLTAAGPGNATLTARAGSMSATATVRVAGSATGPSTFVHENPFPTGNDLWGGASAAGHLFVVGANGTVLALAPTGQWTRLFSYPGVTLRAVAGTGADSAAAVGTSGSSGVLVEFRGATTTPVITLFQSVEPKALWFDGTHGMAVGSGNDVLVRRGGAWTKEYSPSFETLLSVEGDGQGGFVTLGNRGSLYRFDPSTKTWDSLYQSQLSVLLTAGRLVDASGSAAWAAGGGKLWKFEQGGWSAINLPSVPPITDITALGLSGARVLVGASGPVGGQVLVYDRQWQPTDAGLADGGTTSAWTTTTLRGPQVPRAVISAGATAFVAGDYGALWEFDGSALTERSRGFYGHVADVYVAGDTVVAGLNECLANPCTTRRGTVIARTGPSTWQQLGTSQPFSGPVTSVAAAAANDVLAAADGMLFRFDGVGWSPVPVSGSSGGTYRDLQICGSTVWAVSTNGMVFRGTTGQLATVSSLSSSALTAIHCPTESELWIAGDRNLYERTATGQFVSRQSQGTNHAPWEAVWSPGKGEAFAVGDARYGLYWDTVRLNVFDTPGGILPDALHGLWGTSIDNLYAVGYTVAPVAFGYAVRFDGAQWRLVDSGAQRRVTGIHGRPGKELWIGTEGGGLLRGVGP